MTVKQSSLGSQEAQRKCCRNSATGLAVGSPQEMRMRAEEALKQRCKVRKAQDTSREY